MEVACSVDDHMSVPAPSPVHKCTLHRTIFRHVSRLLAVEASAFRAHFCLALVRVRWLFLLFLCSSTCGSTGGGRACGRAHGRSRLVRGGARSTLLLSFE